MEYKFFRRIVAGILAVLLLCIAAGCKKAAPEQTTTDAATESAEMPNDAPSDEPFNAQDGDAATIPSHNGVGEWDSGNTVTNPSQNSSAPTSGGQTTTPPAVGENGAFMSYKDFVSMSPADQRKAMESYFGADADGVAAFHAWLKEAKAAYEKENPPVSGDGNFNIGDY